MSYAGQTDQFSTRPKAGDSDGCLENNQAAEHILHQVLDGCLENHTAEHILHQACVTNSQLGQGPVAHDQTVS